MGKQLGEAPSLAVVLGSGVTLDGIERAALPYEEIPFMPASGVAGHSGLLRILDIEDRKFVVMAGRKHMYEGAYLDDVTFATRMLVGWGVRHLILTNAAGALSEELDVGDLMLITGTLDLLRPTGERGVLPALVDGPVRRNTKWLSEEITEDLKQGTYAAVLGPNYETRAEVALLLSAKADAVGMSTVPELMAAEEAGMQAAGLSVITNTWAKPAAFHGHDAVVKAAAKASVNLQGIIERILTRLEEEV
ncbi:MAG: purine-nucleoside phosphorylase [Planctomycetota bacterium]|nr:purine-nucleoside phosphorylase [Planctomycetota bacterium]